MRKMFAVLVCMLVLGCLPSCGGRSVEPPHESTAKSRQAISVGYFTNNTVFLDPLYADDDVNHPLRSQPFLDETLQKLWDRKIGTLVVTHVKVTKDGYLSRSYQGTPGDLSSGITYLLDAIGAWEAATGNHFDVYAMVQVHAACKLGSTLGGNYSNCTTDNDYANLGDYTVRTTMENEIYAYLHNPWGAAYMINARPLDGILMDMEPGGDPGAGDTGLSPQNIVNQRQVVTDLRNLYGGYALLGVAVPKYACKKVGTTYTGYVLNALNCSASPYSWGLATYWWMAKYADLQIAMVYDTGTTTSSNPNFYEIAKANAYYGSMSVSGEIYRAMWSNDPHGFSEVLPTGRYPQFQIGFAAYDNAPDVPQHFMNAENIQNGAQGALAGYTILPNLCWYGPPATATPRPPGISPCTTATAYQRSLVNHSQGAAVWKHRSGISCERTVPPNTQPCDPANGVAKWDSASTDISTPSNPDWYWWQQYWSGF